MNRNAHARNPRFALPALVAAAALLGCPSSTDPGLTIGVLLPRTGQLADSGGHGESAAIMAAEQINLAGGVAGQPLSLMVKDTRSDRKFGEEAARALVDASLLGVLGPEEEDVAEALALVARDRQLVQISGGVTSPRFTTLDDGGYFFRTCPSSLVTATALAQRMYDDGMRRVSFLYVPNDFGSAFVSSAVVAFQAEGGDLVSQGSAAPVSVQPDQQDFRSLLSPLLALEPDALLLATDPVSGARLVRDWRLLGGRGRIYFAPTLMTDVFVREVPAGSIEGMVGVSAITGSSADAFAQAYAGWSGEAPAQAAYFYYDATALLALAVEKAHRDAGALPTGAQIRAALPAVSAPPGEPVRWNELARGLELVRAGQEIDYQGASGEVNLDDRGDVALEEVDFWSVRGRDIVREAR